MFSKKLKEEIANKIQNVLQGIEHPEMPKSGNITFNIHIRGAESWSWADICDNQQYKLTKELLNNFNSVPGDRNDRFYHK